MIPFKCFKPNGLMAASKELTFSMGKKQRTDAETMQANINHHQMDQIVKVDSKTDYLIFSCRYVAALDVFLKLSIRFAGVDKRVNPFVSKK